MKPYIRVQNRSIVEWCNILMKSNSATVCSLPHYRFQTNWRNIRALEFKNFVRRSGRNPESVNFVPTDLFKEWQSEFESGVTKHYPLKWIKQRKTGHDLI